jgi:cobalt-precorrin-5B (C1)-methyltransferase
MIIDAVREVTTNGVTVRISIPEGEILAQKTFNPRLGIKGGLSILGTSGIVRPFSSSAIRDSIACAINVAVACKVRHPVMVPGGIGLKAAFSIFALNEEQVVEVSNEWGHCLDRAAGKEFSAALVLGHPGKLAKLAGGSWDTHSSRSGSAAPYVETVARSELGYDPKGCGTVEAIFQGLALSDRKRLANALSMRISSAINSRINGKFPCSVFLIDLAGNRLGHYGDLTPWPTKGE